MQLENKIVIITGAGSGIGAASASLLAKHKALVIISDINIDSAQKVADQIKISGGKAFAFKADVSKFEEVELLIAHTVKDHGKIDVLVIGEAEPVAAHVCYLDQVAVAVIYKCS